MRAHAALFLLLIETATVRAQDWPQWRGPGRDGILAGVALPAAWPEKLAGGWRLEIGEGHASPLYAAGKLFVFSRQGENEVVRAVDPASGKTLWQQSYAAPYTVNPAAASHGKGPKSTPLYYQDKLYTLGISGILGCWDGAVGKPLWRKEFAKQFPSTSPLYGTAMSPLGADGMVIAHVGGHGGGALTAFDAASGDVKWQWKDDGPAYASPVLADLGGTRAVVTQTESHVAALRLSDGKLLWKAPFTTSYVQNSVTPVDLGGGAVVYSGLNNGATAVKLAPGGDAWTAKPLWQTSEASFYMNTPVRVGGALYGLSHRNKGEFVALDAASGKLLWKSPPRQGDNAAIIAAGETLLLLTTDGQLTVARAAPRAFEVVKRYAVSAAPTWAHPALIPGGLVVKDVSHLILWRFR